MRRLTLVLAAALVGSLGLTPARGVASARQDALIKLLGPPMTTVVKLVAVESWSPRFDELVQTFPGAAPLGAKWNKDAPAWQKARSALSGRLTRIVDAYAASGDLTERLEAALAKNFPGDQRNALLKVLTGPDGPSIIHSEALVDFLVGARPDSDAQPGDKAYQMESGRLVKKFEAAAGSSIPRRDPGREKAVGAFMNDAMGLQFHLVWSSVLRGAATEIKGVVNLMLFDDRDAIVREMMQAVATVK